jgi:hypothetical protein
VPALVAGSGYLRSDAATKFRELSNAFQAKFGSALVIREGYRSYDRQVYLYNGWIQKLPGFNYAAAPGSSNHGWATACDFASGVDSYGTAQKIWMDANAPAFGWSPTGNGFPSREPWHFDYTLNYTPINKGLLMALSDAEQAEVLNTVRALAGFLYAGGTDAAAGRFDSNSVIGRVRSLQEATFYGGPSMKDGGRSMSQSLADVNTKISSVFDATFNGGSSMKDAGKSISQSLADINGKVS